jgi:hypothetical protein
MQRAEVERASVQQGHARDEDVGAKAVPEDDGPRPTRSRWGKRSTWNRLLQEPLTDFKTRSNNDGTPLEHGLTSLDGIPKR